MPKINIEKAEQKIKEQRAKIAAAKRAQAQKDKADNGRLSALLGAGLVAIGSWDSVPGLKDHLNKTVKSARDRKLLNLDAAKSKPAEEGKQGMLRSMFKAV